MIMSIVSKEGRIVSKKDTISEWIYNPRVIGKEKKYSQFYFNIAIINDI